MKFFVLGDEDAVTGFKFAGIEGTVVSDEKSASAEFDRITGSEGNGIGILVITEETSMMIQDKISAHELSGAYPLVVEIPGMSGHIKSRGTMMDAIRKAVGFNI